MRASSVLALFALSTLGTVASYGDVTVEKTTYLNLANCYRLSNGTVDLIVTTDVGPRIIRYGFVGAPNQFAEMPDAVVKTEFGDWKPLGGHRLWHAPEVIPRTYSPDNSPVEVKLEGTNGIRLTQAVEPRTGIRKEMVVKLEADGTGVTVLHRITNQNVWAVNLAPWALTIVAGGGTTIIPQEPYKSHDDYVLPARPFVMWHYTDLSDPRWKLGKKYIQLRTEKTLSEPQKVGMLNTLGWAGYLREKTFFVKRYGYEPGMHYPDMGCNVETYTAGEFMEIETLAPMQKLEPSATAEHIEKWSLFKNVDGGRTEATLDAAITPLVAASFGAPKR